MQRHHRATLALLLACNPTAPEAPADESTTTTDTSSSTTDPTITTGTTTTPPIADTAPGTTADPAPACDVVDHPGECIDIADCPAGSTAFRALCDGPPSLQCCVPVAPPCSVDGAPGLCIPTDTCLSPNLATPGRCPGDAEIQCCTDPTTACDPDAAPRPNEGLVEVSHDPTCPPGMLRSADTCIDRHEASLIIVNPDDTPGPSWSPFLNPGSTRVRAVSIAGAVPQGYINQIQAAAACEEAGKRLCSDAEWLRACQGQLSNTYPYGPDAVPGACNDTRAAHPAIEYFGTADDWIWSELGHPCISQIPASLALTGQHTSCISEDGALDMMGNLHEWTADPAGTFRGGFYVDTILNGPGCLYATTAHDITHWDYSTGFRCCAD